MSKAALVMDMPSSCEKCRLHSFFGKDCDVICVVRGKTRSYEEAYKSKPDWCPLVPMPEKDLKPFAPPELEEKALSTGEYAARFAESHGISITEAMKHPEVKAYAQRTAENGRKR